MPNRPTILFSLAHPDDESFMVAGVSCKYGARGVRLVLATATLGDAGKVGDPPVCSREELPRVRESELRRAVDLLGIDSLHLLGYRDKELSAADPGRIRGQLVAAAAPLPARCGHHLRPQRVQPAPRPYRHQPVHLGRHRGGGRPPLAAGGRRAPPGDPAAVDAAVAAGRDRGRTAPGQPAGSRFSGRCPGLVGPKGRGLAGPPHPAPLHQSDLVRSSRSGTGAVERTLPAGLGASAQVEA